MRGGADGSPLGWKKMACRVIFQNFFSRHAHFLLHAPEPPYCTPSNIRTQLLEDNEVPVRDQVWSCMLARVPSLKRMCWQTGSLSNFLSFFFLLLLLCTVVAIPGQASMEENDDDDVEVTGWRKETPKLLVECPICHKSLPSQNALWVHCDERHQGRREAVAQSNAATGTRTGTIGDFFFKSVEEKRGRPRNGTPLLTHCLHVGKQIQH